MRLTEKETNEVYLGTAYKLKDLIFDEKINKPLQEAALNNLRSSAINKLGQLEDWEDKLKIDLNIILHALFYGFYGINHTGKIKKYDISNSDIYIHSTHILTCEDGYEFGDEFMFNEYGKTWALTKEELE